MRSSGRGLCDEYRAEGETAVGEETGGGQASPLLKSGLRSLLKGFCEIFLREFGIHSRVFTSIAHMCFDIEKKSEAGRKCPETSENGVETGFPAVPTTFHALSLHKLGTLDA